jgi:hypothetical protein
MIELGYRVANGGIAKLEELVLLAHNAAHIHRAHTHDITCSEDRFVAGVQHDILITLQPVNGHGTLQSANFVSRWANKDIKSSANRPACSEGGMDHEGPKTALCHLKCRLATYEIHIPVED